MSDWSALTRELDLWAAAGQTAAFWWRDDDATAPHPALDRLLALKAEADVALALAVIPLPTDARLAERLDGFADVAVLVHGYAHANHAPPPAKKSELGTERPLAARLAELAAGRDRLAGLFGDRCRAVLVPPWNRCGEDLLPALPRLGFAAISAFRSRRRAATVEGLARIDCHLDPADWRRQAAFVGEGPALGALIDQLQARRRGEGAPNDPIGLLTHHRRCDDAAWSFVAALLRRTKTHPAARWLGIDEILAQVAAPMATARRQ